MIEREHEPSIAALTVKLREAFGDNDVNPHMGRLSGCINPPPLSWTRDGPVSKSRAVGAERGERATSTAPMLAADTGRIHVPYQRLRACSRLSNKHLVVLASACGLVGSAGDVELGDCVGAERPMRRRTRGSARASPVLLCSIYPSVRSPATRRASPSRCRATSSRALSTTERTAGSVSA